MSHLKRYAMPPMWPLSRKAEKYVIRPMPGPHGKDHCIPLQIVLRDMLHVAASAQEAQHILTQGKVLVDKQPRTEAKFPVGHMDVIEIPEIKKQYRVGLGKKGLVLGEISAAETAKKLCRIVRKTTAAKGKTQVTLHDGRNLLVDDPKAYKVGDSLMIGLPDQKILTHYKLEKGARAVIIAGSNRGAQGTIKEVRHRTTMIDKSTVTLNVQKNDIRTSSAYVMVGEV